MNCLRKLKYVYDELVLADKENICDIIELAKAGSIDMTNYFEDSKSKVQHIVL